MKKHLLPILLVAMVAIFCCGIFVCSADDEDYIEIKTAEDLYNIRDNLSGNYKLMKDLDLSGETAVGGIYDSEGNGWIPIGTSAAPFTGIFDGNGHTICGIRQVAKLNNARGTIGGLFLYNSGEIKNLNYIIDDLTCKINSSGGAYVRVGIGGIAGENSGTISRCSVSGGYKGVMAYWTGGHIYAYMGGISGTGTGTVSECFSDISYENITGRNDGDGSSCDIYMNGISYSNNARNCYSLNVHVPTGNVYRPADIVREGEGTAVNCYTVEPDCLSGCYYDNNGKRNFLNAAQLKSKSTFTSFDFADVWTIETATDYKFPQLKNNMMDSAKHVDTIEWKTEPSKIEYYTDEDIDPSGGVFTAYYIDDTHENIKVTKDMLSGYDMTQLGVQTVTVTFREGTLTYDILTSTRPEVKSLTLESMPNKTEFARGTSFDFTGATAKVEYVNGKSDIIPITAKETTGGNINQSGTYTITYEKFGKSISFEVKVVPVKPISLVISSLPNKTSYIEGQQIDTTGLVVKLEYNNGRKETITDYTIEKYATTVGTRNINISREDFSASFQVEFVKKTLTGIMVTTQPSRAKYVVGEEFDPSGMVVKAVYDNGYSEEITDYKVSSLTAATGWQTLTVSYNGKTATVKVMVEAKELVSISVSQMPLKTTYIEGESFDPKGLIIMGNYNDVLQEEVNDYSLTGTTLNKVGKKTITVLCEGCSATFDVTVIAKTLTKITVTPPKKIDYIAGEEFDNTGMVVNAVYDNGKSEPVTNYTLSGFGEDEEANTILVKYGGKSAGFIVTIHNPESEWTIVTKPTCTMAGEKVLYCSNCQKVLDTKEIAAEGHKWDAWAEVKSPNCTDKGSEKHTCSVCKLTEYRDVDPNGHTWENKYTVDSDPTCAHEGTESIHCSVCHVSNPDSVRSIDKNPHEYGAWTKTKDPTCVETGVRSRTCNNCKHVDTEDIPATGIHSFEEWYTVKAATCVKAGSKERRCDVCQYVEETSIPATGKHSYGAWKTKKATELAAGSKTRTCTECKKVEKQTIKQLKPTLPAVAITTPSSTAKKTATIKWKKISSANQKKIASLQIQYSTDKNFKKNVKTATAKKNTVSKKVTKLTSKKKYYVRVRAYKKDKKGVHVSKWSAVKAVRVK